jgi:hypothetical protein
VQTLFLRHRFSAFADNRKLPRFRFSACCDNVKMPPSETVDIQVATTRTFQTAGECYTFCVLLLPWIAFFCSGCTWARSPSGKAKVCKTFIVGSIPSRASNFFVSEAGIVGSGRSGEDDRSRRRLQQFPRKWRSNALFLALCWCSQ